jgi:RNA polymerase sigma factor (TIGR02999 family)
MSIHPGEITALLALAREGDRQAAAALIEIVYPELRRLAASYMRRECPEHTLQPTALVHEAYLRLAGQPLDLENRAHFFGVAAHLMRQILVEHARSRKALKRNAEKVPIEGDQPLAAPEWSEDLVALDQALDKLSAIDERQSRIVELRFFGGLTIGETASALGISEKTVKRDWILARAWLHREISRGS